MTTTSVRTYLEMTSPQDLRPARDPSPLLRLERVAEPPPGLYRFLYSAIGAGHHWTDRSGWSDADIRAHVARRDVAEFILRSGGSPAGWFELVVHGDGSVEIAYFGLLPEFRGRGLGRHLLTLAVDEAWRLKPNRVWLHTSSLDHAAALPNYEARGFRVVRRQSYPRADDGRTIQAG